MVPFVEVLDVERLHVQAPTEIIFLCGGVCTGVGPGAPASLRDAFQKVAHFSSLGGRDVVLAEDFTKLHIFSSHYNNILEFEAHLAQITELVILFCESPGSFTELGAFTMIPDVAGKLLAIIRDSDWQADSFIKLGPLDFLEKHHQNSVFVIDDAAIGIAHPKNFSVDLHKFKNEIEPPLRTRLEVVKEPTTFDPQRVGHIVKLIVGYVQEFGALEFEEILYIVSRFVDNPTEGQVRSYLLCATVVEWLEEKQKGFRKFYVATSGKPAITFSVKSADVEKNRVRRRALIRDHWKEKDAQRFRAISEVVITV